MKIITVCTALFLLATAALQAQHISEHALGLRLGDNDGFGAEISYQKAITELNRVEFDLGWRDSKEYDAFKLVGLYQWICPLESNLNWYYGVGGGLGSVDFASTLGVEDDNDGFFALAAGNIGVEYSFEVPLLLSLDFRPEVGLVGYDGFDSDFDFDVALGIRYKFQ